MLFGVLECLKTWCQNQNEVLSLSQAIVFVDINTSQQLVRYVGSISRESIVDIEAKVSKVPQIITGCSQKDAELHVRTCFVVSLSEPSLPLQIEDAMRRAADDATCTGAPETEIEGSEKPEEGVSQLARVKQDTKLGMTF